MPRFGLLDLGVSAILLFYCEFFESPHLLFSRPRSLSLFPALSFAAREGVYHRENRRSWAAKAPFARGRGVFRFNVSAVRFDDCLRPDAEPSLSMAVAVEGAAGRARDLGSGLDRLGFDSERLRFFP